MKRGIVLFLAILFLGIPQVFVTSETVEFQSSPGFLGRGGSFADLPEPELLFPLAILAQAVSSDVAPEIPQNLRNNRYFTESLRLANLARLAYNNGDYDTSARYAEEAVQQARSSDEYIALQLKIRETNNAITTAKRQIDQTVSSGVSTYFPTEFGQAQNYYNNSLTLRSAEAYDQAIDSAKQAVVVLADLRAPAVVVAPEPEPAPPPAPIPEPEPVPAVVVAPEPEPVPGPEPVPEVVVAPEPEPEPEPVPEVVVAPEPEPEPEPVPEVVVAPEPEPEPVPEVVVAPEPEPEPEPAPVPEVVSVPEPEPEPPAPTPAAPPPPVLPAQYTVQPWNPWRDCFWNIAGRSWAYGDPTKWRIIYEANRSKLPESDNPNLVHPGTVLDIPSIQGEVRQGLWDARTEYPSFR
jgi:nucleoid-associated protein YgaU